MNSKQRRCVLWCVRRRKEGFPGGSVVKNLPANAGDMGSFPGLGRSLGVENGMELLLPE